MTPALSEKTMKFLQDTCIFCQPWWLEAVSPGQWDVAVVERGEEVAAVLPYAYKTRLGRFRLLEMPPLTPYLGPWIRPHLSHSESGHVSEEKKLLTELIQKLPSFATFIQGFHPSVTDWLPFFWQGFNQTTYYTYIIGDLSNVDQVISNFSHAKRKNIKRARGIVEVREDLPSKEFYDNLVLTLSKKKQRALYSFNFFKKFYEACYQHQAGKVFYAIDSKNNIHSAIFIVFDSESAYYLISTIDPEFKTSGSVSLLVQEAIRFSAKRVLKFDFCGSMNETIERSSREFGGKQTPYFFVQKIPSPIVQGYRTLWKWTHWGGWASHEG